MDGSVCRFRRFLLLLAAFTVFFLPGTQAQTGPAADSLHTFADPYLLPWYNGAGTFGTQRRPMIARVREPELACISSINVTLNDSCAHVVDPLQVLTGDFDGVEPELFVVTILAGTPDGGNTVVGCGTYRYSVALDSQAMGGVTGFVECGGEITARDNSPITLASTPVGRNDLLCMDVAANNVNLLPAGINRCYLTDGAGELVSIDPELLAVLSPDVFGDVAPDTALVPVFRDNCADLLEVCVSDVIHADESGCNATVIERYFTARQSTGCPLTDGSAVSVQAMLRLTFTRPTFEDLFLGDISAVVEVETCAEEGAERNFLPRPVDYPVLLTDGGRSFNLGDAGSMCSMGLVLYDNPSRPIRTCPATVKFERRFTVVDWCDPTEVLTYTQFVKLGDSTGPEISEPLQRSFSTNVGTSCSAVVRLDLPGLGTFDACSGTDNELRVSIFPEGDRTLAAYGYYTIDFFNGEPELSAPLPIGAYSFVYTATDACGNSTELTVPFTVVDGQTPFLICEDGLNVSLEQPTGTAVLTPDDVNVGSSDDCSGRQLTYGLAYTDDRDVPPTAFDRRIEFTCADLGTQFVTLRATDAAGNSNTCWLEVNVEFKNPTPPLCFAPNNVEISCERLEQLLPSGLELATEAELDAVFGTATAIGLCETTVTSVLSGLTSEDCGSATATRSFVVEDGLGQVSSEACVQEITVTGVCRTAPPAPVCEERVVATLESVNGGPATACLAATDFLSGPVVDCFGDTVTDFGIVRSGAGPATLGMDTLKVGCPDFGDFVEVEVYAFGANNEFGEARFCRSLVEVREGDGVRCGGGGNVAGGPEGYSDVIRMKSGRMISNQLHQNAPNPITDHTRVTFDLAQEGPVTFRVHDITGRLILLRIMRGHSGSNSIAVNRADLGSAGTYIYSVQAGAFHAARQLIVADK